MQLASQATGANGSEVRSCLRPVSTCRPPAIGRRRWTNGRRPVASRAGTLGVVASQWRNPTGSAKIQRAPSWGLGSIPPLQTDGQGPQRAPPRRDKPKAQGRCGKHCRGRGDAALPGQPSCRKGHGPRHVRVPGDSRAITPGAVASPQTSPHLGWGHPMTHWDLCPEAWPADLSHAPVACRPGRRRSRSRPQL